MTTVIDPNLRLKEIPHRRFNPLTGDWVLVSPHRTERPWQGQLERTITERPIIYDPDCYLCPGNSRAGGIKNPIYEKTFVFENDFAALKSLPQSWRMDECGRGLIAAESEVGICRVICFSPRHDLTIARMNLKEITNVVEVWSEQYGELGSLPFIHNVQIFENRGAIMGCSNPHPHCQVWANQTIPNEPTKEQKSQLNYLATHGKCLLCDYLELEKKAGERVVIENDWFVALVPFWAVWPFEVLVLGKKHSGSLAELGPAEQQALAHVLKSLTTCYDNLFETSFPYSMGFHQKPTDGEAHEEWHMHAHFFPPLLRSSTIRKYMVGYEMLGAPQRDTTPESAAARIREASGVHYLER